jgi:hypothetical protein
MIKLFRVLNPVNIFWLAVFLIILRINFVAHLPAHLEFTFLEPFAHSLIPISYENFFSSISNLLVAAVLVFIQALWLNQLINKYNLLGKPTFLPALMFITASSMFVPFLILSPPLICNFLVILMIDKLFNFYKNEGAKTTAYDLGMIVGVGTLIYFPVIYMFLAVWIALIIFRPFNWREWTSVLMGFITIFFFLAVYYYLTDRIKLFYTIWLPLGRSFPSKIQIDYYNYVVLIPVIIILALAFLSIREKYFKSFIQTRKSFQLLFIIFIIALLSFYIKANFRLSHFILCAVPASVFFAYYFLYATKRWFYETLYILLVISIIYFQFNKF